MSTTKYVVTFERIGRRHDFEPEIFEALDANDLAEQVYRFARRHLASRDVDVAVDLEVGSVSIGWGRFGSGTVTEVAT